MMSAAATTSASGTKQHTWEETTHTWSVEEDAEGNIVVAAGDTLAEAIRKRRKRLEQNDHSQRSRQVVRDMLRYLYIIVDASRWSRARDTVISARSSRLDATVEFLQDFVREYYDQNPLSHLGFIFLKNGEAEILSPLSSSSKTHKVALQSVAQMAASEGPLEGGEFSLQNGLEVAGRSLGHQPRHGSREIIIVTAALATCDPGYLLTETLPKLIQANIRVSAFALSAELHVCRKLADETGGIMGVCLDRPHFRDWMKAQCVPPPSAGLVPTCSMMRMGFPTRSESEIPELVHATRTQTIMSRTAHECPQCQAKNAELPVDCAVCGLKLVVAPHLARSFHHLFPVPPFREVNQIVKEETKSPDLPVSKPVATTQGYVDSAGLLSELQTFFCASCLRPLEAMRFDCPDCGYSYCLDCDAFLHETLHNCPTCLRRDV